MLSLNNRLIVAQYKKEEIKSKVEGGFARMAHKTSLCPLTVLVDAKLSDGTLVPKGSTVYVKEETLFLRTAAGANGGAPIATYSNEKVSADNFHILELSQVEMVDIGTV